ncbi:hypothetical protein A2714_05665 [Candidatus Woesebacteria bacterium RIFCSPHIGHO2_01_FULL_38_9]|uniref:Membrane protein 6-pyruvoyl-tetrahydropterin synthase-related domain-containing protein n=2 Tax=Candidatus Woeseibacteriota TaxID=1752722 RepID=A0A1F7Y1D8_9BACT|nr:MAG: hypothetical protein A2714_05665 [Candidatus Woesebacteria bacterium RIFCSPHIGHO2_01_FULL_38_9]OGM58364.1 MAG: hypothetical protein A3A75_05045 [Candidatus Woesebacteria bacterium RIFCSPLOWO2_01_FULL_39_10]
MFANKKNDLFAFVLIFLISVSLCVVWFRGGDLLGTGESGLLFYNAERQYEISQYAWSDVLLGSPRSIYTSGIPTYWFLSKVQSLGIPSFLLEALTFGFLFFVAGSFVYLLIKELFPRLDRKIIFLGVLFYWFNPISIVNVWNRFLYNHFVFWALLPLASFLFIRGIRLRKLAYAVGVSLSSAAFSYALSSPASTILLWLLLTYICVYYFIINKSIRPFLTKYFVICLSSFLAFNFWWLSQLFFYIRSSSYSYAVESFFSSEDNLSGLTDLSNLLGMFSNNIRFLHGTFFEVGPFWANFYTSKTSILIQFLLFLVIFIATFSIVKKRKILFLEGGLIITLFLMKGNNPPFGELYEAAFLRFKFFQIFRNPFEKFGFFLPLFSAPLFIFGLSRLIDHFEKKLVKRVIFTISFGCVALFWGFPFWTGLVFSSGHKDTNEFRSYNVEVPGYYKDANEWLEGQGGNFRFIVLPIRGEGVSYLWPKGYEGIEISSTLFSRPNISFDTTVPLYSEVAGGIIDYQMDKSVINFSPFTNSKYFLARSDINFKKERMANPENIKLNFEEMLSLGMFQEKYQFGELSFYELNADYRWPKIYSTSNIWVTNDSDINKLISNEKEFPRRKVAIVDRNFAGIGEKLKYKSLFSPSKIFNYKEFLETEALTDDDILSRLFYTKHLPNKWYYFFVRVKERLQTPPYSDYDGWIIYNVGLLGKRAVEVYKLMSDDKIDPKLVNRAEKDYLVLFKKLQKNLKSSTLSDNPVSRVIRESLFYQYILFKKVNSENLEYLDNFFLDVKMKPMYDLPTGSYDYYLVYHFDIPLEGLYTISEDFKEGLEEVYLDGDKICATDCDKSDNNLLELNSGDHELAFALDDKRSFQTEVLQIDHMGFADKDFVEWEIDLPSTPTPYKIAFDYKFRKGVKFKVIFQQDIDQDKLPIFQSQVRKDDAFHDWRLYEAEFSSSPGAKYGKIVFKADKDMKCSMEWWGKESCNEVDSGFEVELKNITVRKVRFPEVNLILDYVEDEPVESMVEWEMVNPTEYKVKLSKNSDQPELLVFSELYNSQWGAFYEGGEKLPEWKHVLVNVYANAWLIDKKGDYEIVLRHLPQKTLVYSSRISLFSFLLALLYLFVNKLKKKHEAN